jgi:hypothetical protein
MHLAGGFTGCRGQGVGHVVQRDERVARPAVPGQQREAEAVQAPLGGGAHEPREPEAALARRLPPAARRQPGAEPRQPQLHEQRGAHDCERRPVGRQGRLRRGLGVEVRRTLPHQLARDGHEHESLDAGGAGNPAELGVPVGDGIVIGAVAGSRDDHVRGRADRLDAIADLPQTRGVAEVAAHDAGAADRTRVGGRPHQRGHLLAPLAQAAHEREAELAGCAEDEDHSARSLRSSSSRSTAFPLSAIARSYALAAAAGSPARRSSSAWAAWSGW